MMAYLWHAIKCKSYINDEIFYEDAKTQRRKDTELYVYRIYASMANSQSSTVNSQKPKYQKNDFHFIGV